MIDKCSVFHAAIIKVPFNEILSRWGSDYFLCTPVIWSRLMVRIYWKSLDYHKSWQIKTCSKCPFKNTVPCTLLCQEMKSFTSMTLSFTSHELFCPCETFLLLFLSGNMEYDVRWCFYSKNTVCVWNKAISNNNLTTKTHDCNNRGISINLVSVQAVLSYWLCKTCHYRICSFPFAVYSIFLYCYWLWLTLIIVIE